MRYLPRALASGAQGLQPGVTARCSSARVGGRVAKFSSVRVGVCEGAKRGEVYSPATCEVHFGSAAKSAARRRAKFPSAARQGLQPGDVISSLRRAPVGEGARRRARARRGTICSPARCSACRRGRRRGGLQVHNPVPRVAPATLGAGAGGGAPPSSSPSRFTEHDIYDQGWVDQ